MAAHLVALVPAALPPLTPIRLLTSWRRQPGVLAAVAALGRAARLRTFPLVVTVALVAPLLVLYLTDEGSPQPRLWWEDDPQIAQRFRRRQ